MRREAWLDRAPKEAPTGPSRRATLTKAAEAGNARARSALRSPPCPEALEYLRAWAYALVGRSGASDAGAAPLSYGTIEAWARLMGVPVPQPYEVEALFALDALMRCPGEDEPPAEGEP